MRTFPRSRSHRTLDTRIATKRFPYGIFIDCSARVHATALYALGFKATMSGGIYWPAEKLVDGRIPGEAREYVKRFYDPSRAVGNNQ